MQQTVTIASRFNGPPNSGNGGYVAGVIARNLKGPVEVSLKSPPPLEKGLILVTDGAAAKLMDGDMLVGVGAEVDAQIEVRPLPKPLNLTGSPLDGPNMEGKFRPFGNCFVCGDNRTAGDGLCLYSQCVDGQHDMVAASWDLDPCFAGEDGFIDPVFIWAALDCPGYFACSAGEAALLGKFTVEILAPLKAGGTATVLGWDKTEDRDSRKRFCGTAVYSSDGTLIAKAEGLWIKVPADKIKSTA